MEPVPETERMEEFKTTLPPILRLQEPAAYIAQNDDLEPLPRTPTSSLRRSATDSLISSPLSPAWPSPSTMSFRPRNTSPYSRGHYRSRSSASALAPPMLRAQSMPGVNGAGHLLMSPMQRPASPAGSPNRVRVPRKPVDEVFPGLPHRVLTDIGELQPGSPMGSDGSTSPILGLPINSSLSKTPRPASPLRHITQQPTSAPGTMPSTPASTSWPSAQAPRLNDPLITTSYTSYPSSFTSSSVPSTPTSARSRSPSISSLETIPDSPDAEEAALEAERIAQLKAAADAAERGEPGLEGKMRELGIRGRTLATGFGSRDKRKRWSVCGAERRSDLNLDTIWED
ncbi:hypothetical protein F5884DRAFT_665676 [Xylogone sp. PMI_703]|nr:hypothetical protein F5884DRAFT_665676 [Xylogone sp. PMI_703]